MLGGRFLRGCLCYNSSTSSINCVPTAITHNMTELPDGHLRQLRKSVLEERIAHDKMLLQIRNAKTMKERNSIIIAARKAGYTYRLIGMAANLTRQRIHVIVTAGSR